MSEEDRYDEPTEQPEVEPFSPEEAAAKSEEVLRLEQAIGQEPRPADFTDYDEYVKSLTDYGIKKHNYEYRARVIQDNPHADVSIVTAEGVRAGMEAWAQQQAQAQAEAQAQAQRDPGPIPDDPYRAKRAELERMSMEFSKEAIKQKERGNLHDPVTGFYAQRERQAQYEDELAKLPPKPERQFAEDTVDNVDFRSINLLFDKNHANDKMWDSPRMQNDASVVLVRHNSRSRHGAIALPAESSPFGNPLPVKPENMVQVKLPPDQLKTFQDMVYRSGGDDDSPDAVIRRSWRVLHRMGYSGTAQPALEKKTAKKAEGEVDPDKMSWQEFVKWREATEDKKRGRPRQGFAMSRKNK